MSQPIFKLTPPRKQRGFTLTELMVTIVIVGILTSVAVPSFRSFIVSQRVKSTSFDLIAALNMTRSEAIKRNTNVIVTPTGGSWLNGWTINYNNTVGGVTTNIVLNNQSALGSGLAVTCYNGAALTTPCQNIAYASSGRLIDPVTNQPPAAQPRIQVTSNDPSVPAGFAVRCISADLTGRPNSKKGACP